MLGFMGFIKKTLDMQGNLPDKWKGTEDEPAVMLDVNLVIYNGSDIPTYGEDNSVYTASIPYKVSDTWYTIGEHGLQIRINGIGDWYNKVSSPQTHTNVVNSISYKNELSGFEFAELTVNSEATSGDGSALQYYNPLTKENGSYLGVGGISILARQDDNSTTLKLYFNLSPVSEWSY